jgi:hypothetical protein
MAPKSKSASQLTRRNISVPSWVWSLVLLAAAVFALAIYQSAQGAPAPNVQARMDQAQESVAHYSAALDTRRDPSAESVAAYLDAHDAMDRTATSAAWRNPVQQTVEVSVRRRNAEPSSRSIDPAFRSVLNFVGTHGLQYASEAPEVLLDAGAKSYTDYLRRHGLLPAIVPAETPIDPQVLALISKFSLVLGEATPQNDSLVNPTAQQRPASSELPHPEQEEKSVRAFNTKITEREQQLLDQHNQ